MISSSSALRKKTFIIADTLSRAHLSQTKQQTEEICEEIKTYKHSVFLPGIFIAWYILQDSKWCHFVKLFILWKLSNWPENKN